MSLSKNQLRKIYGVEDSTSPEDQEVLVRRKYHRMVAQWLAKRDVLLETTFASIGFFIVLLPMFSKGWRSVIEKTPIVSTIFHDYSTMSGLALINLHFLLAAFMLRSLSIKNLPGKTVSPMTHRHIVEMELFPRTKNEEFSYWANILFSATGSTLWLFLPFGVMAYFMNIGR